MGQLPKFKTQKMRTYILPIYYLNDFNSRLMEIIKPVTEENPDPYKQRLDRLREKSKELQMGWCDNKKDLVKQLAEKFLTNTTKVILIFS